MFKLRNSNIPNQEDFLHLSTEISCLLRHLCVYGWALVRHGHTEVADNGIVAGFNDVKLSTRGKASLASLGATIQNLQFDTYYASDLIRAQQSMELITSAPYIIDERLKELNFGDWEGKSWNDVHNEQPEALNTWSTDWVNNRPPNGETFGELAVRCESWLDERLLEENNTTLVTSHGGSIRALLCVALKLPLSSAMQFEIDHASVTKLELSDTGNRCLFVNRRAFN